MRRASDAGSCDDAAEEGGAPKRLRGPDDGGPLRGGGHQNTEGWPPGGVTATFQRRAAIEQSHAHFASAGNPVWVVTAAGGRLYQCPAGALTDLTPPSNFLRPVQIGEAELWPDIMKMGVPVMVNRDSVYVSPEHLSLMLYYISGTLGTATAVDTRYLVYVLSANDVLVKQADPDAIFTHKYTATLSRKYLGAMPVTMSPSQIGLMLESTKQSQRKGKWQFAAVVCCSDGASRCIQAL